jgi:hypothetical protein
MDGKSILQLVFSGIGGKITHIQFIIHYYAICPILLSNLFPVIGFKNHH